MRIPFTVFLFFITFCLFSQGEIIDRDTRSGKDFNLKITEVKNDSLTYKYFGKTKKIPLSSVIAYRIDYNTDEFIFPDPQEKAYYVIRDGIAVSKRSLKYNLKDKEKKELSASLLSIYKIQKDAFENSTLSNKIFLQNKKDSSQVVKASPKRRIYIILKKDSVNLELYGKIYKIKNDSIIYFSTKIKEEISYYAINKTELRFIGIEPQKAFAMRMIFGTASIVLVPSLVGLPIPIHFFSTPNLIKYDLEYYWKLKLFETEMNKQK